MMKKLLLGLTLLLTSTSFAQQIGNSDFENWDNAGTEDQEPTNWNSFMTANCSLGSIACGIGQNQQVERSTEVRTGSAGTYSARIYSISVLGVVANGNLTLGRIKMGSTTANDPSNHNYTIASDANFSEVFTDTPDSIVFWVKSTMVSGSSESRVSAVIHNNTDGYKDPNDVAGPNTVATAIVNYTSTSDTWVRKSVPFTYVGIPGDAAFMIITITTNKTPGGGAAGDEVFIDDLQLIYNPTGNQQMVANDDSFSGNQDNDIICDVLANDTDPENDLDATSVSIITNPTNGIVSVDAGNGEITYTPNTGFSGSDSFIYEVCDGGSPSTCDQGTVNLSVNAVGLEENKLAALSVKSIGNTLYFGGIETMTGSYEIYNLTGSVVKKGNLVNQVTFNEKTGVYLISIVTSTGKVTRRIYKN